MKVLKNDVLVDQKLFKEKKGFESFLDYLDEEKLAANRQVERINKSQRIMTWSFIAMLMFCGGFLFYYWKNVQPDTWQYYLSIGSTVLGFFIYIGTRVQLILLKRGSK